MLEMTTNAGIVSDALKYVERKTEQLNTFAKSRRKKRRGGRGNNY
jgi:hypothetical protein